MQEIATPKKPKSLWKLRALAAGVSLSGLVAAASAEIDLNGTVGPILDSVIALIPSIVALIVAVVPAIITLSLVAFIVGFFDRILGMMKL
jgi:hypothetical protein